MKRINGRTIVALVTAVLVATGLTLFFVLRDDEERSGDTSSTTTGSGSSNNTGADTSTNTESGASPHGDSSPSTSPSPRPSPRPTSNRDDTTSSSPPTADPTAGSTSCETESIGPDFDWVTVEAREMLPQGQHETCFVKMPSTDKAYLIGGRVPYPVCAYDMDTRVWQCSEQPLPLERMHHLQCIPVGDEIFIPTGWTAFYPDEENLEELYIYNTVTDSWRTATYLPPERRRGAAAAVYYPPSNSIYVSHGNMGGHAEFSESVAFLDRYDIDTDEWTALADGISVRDHTGGALFLYDTDTDEDDEICVAAGRVGTSVANVVLETECYSIHNNTWESRAPIAVGRAGSAYAGTCDGTGLLVAGGESPDQAHREVSLFDGQSWIELEDMQQGRHGTTSLAMNCDCPWQALIVAGSPVMGGPADQGGLTSMEYFVSSVSDFCQSQEDACNSTST